MELAWRVPTQVALLLSGADERLNLQQTGSGLLQVLAERSKPLRVETFYASFQAAAVAFRVRKIGSDHLLGFSPMKVQFPVPFSCSQLSNLANIEASHYKNVALSIATLGLNENGYDTPFFSEFSPMLSFLRFFLTWTVNVQPRVR